VREIASDAGVTAMMVNRYFGSKEQLFAEAVEVSFTPPAVIADDSESLAHDTATTLVARTNPDADALERHVGRRLARQLPESGRQIRNEVMLSVIAGVLLMRRVIVTRALNEADPDQLVTVLEAVFAAIIETPMA
jgi:AcrR family transcriptional regulator